MKTGQKGVTTAAIVVAVVVVIAVAGAGVFLLLRGREPSAGGKATATVKLHDAQTIDLATAVSEYLPDISGVDITVAGTVTINSFSVTDVTVKLHNSTSGEWVIIAENQTITDMTAINTLAGEISAGVYDKVSVHIGMITIDIAWTEIVINYTLDYTQLGVPEELLPYIQTYLPSSGSYALSAGGFNGSVTLNQTFDITFTHAVDVTAGENQVFDIDTGAPFGFESGFGSDMSYDVGENMGYSMDAGQLSATCMAAYGE